MKKLPALFAVLLIFSASGLHAGEPSDIHTLLRRLDGLLDRREEFLLRHEAHLDSLKSLLCVDTLGFGTRYAVTAEIAERYFAYQSDSTIAFLRRNVALAERVGNADLTIRAKSVMAMCYSMNGRFLEADRVLRGVTDTLSMSRATQAAYYAAQHRQNRECRGQSEPGGGARPVPGLRSVLRPPCAGDHRRHFETFLFRLSRRRGRRGLRPCRRGLRQCAVVRSARVARLCPGGVLPFGDRKVPGRRDRAFPNGSCVPPWPMCRGPSATTAPWAPWPKSCCAGATPHGRCGVSVLRSTTRRPTIRPSARGATWRFCPRSNRRTASAMPVCTRCTSC